jgi:RNA polymerase sigma factor (sigma-70 family)
MLPAAHPTPGEPGAEERVYRELYIQHWDVLFRIAGQKIGDFQQSCDLVQDVFTHVWQSRTFLELPPEKERAYLVTCLYYRILNHWRSRGLENKHYAHYARFSDSQGLVESFLSPRYAEEQFEAIHVMILGELEKMPERMRQIFLMHRYQKKSVTEIAAELSVSEKTVRNQLSIGLKRLKDHASTQGEGVYLPLLLLILLS